MSSKDVAVLPNRLQNQMSRVHVAPVAFGTLLIIMAGFSMARLESNIFAKQVCTGAVTLFTGWFGLYATLQRSMPFHVVCLVVSIFATGLGLETFSYIEMTLTDAPIKYKYEGMLLANYFLVLLNLVITFSIIALEATILYLANTRPIIDSKTDQETCNLSGYKQYQ